MYLFSRVDVKFLNPACLLPLVYVLQSWDFVNHMELLKNIATGILWRKITLFICFCDFVCDCYLMLLVFTVTIEKCLCVNQIHVSMKWLLFSMNINELLLSNFLILCAHPQLYMNLIDICKCFIPYVHE